jgi:anti-anti-sigma factor
LDEFTISVAAEPAHTLVTLTGECDLNNGRRLRDVLTSEVSRGTRRVIVDLSGLSFMDSTGMQILLSVRTVLALRGGTMALISPQPVVARVLELTGATELIPVYDSLEEAQTAD